MICNGAARRSVKFWTAHLENDKKNDRAELKEIRGLAAENLRDALLEMEEDARNTRLKNFFYQANFNPPPGAELNEEQWQRCFEIFERHRGIPEGTARVVYEHEKEGRTHRHVLWSRVDTETGRAWPDGLDAKICQAASLEMAQELGLEHSLSPLNKDREGPRPDRAPKSWEMFRGFQSGFDPREIKAEVTAIFRESEHAEDFVNGLRQHSYQLVQGDRRDYCILDPAGEVHSLARRIDGVKAKELRVFMKDLDRSEFPTVEQAKTLHHERVMEGHLEDMRTVEFEIAWEERLMREGIKKEMREERFKEPTAKEMRERRKAHARWPLTPPVPEPTLTSPKLHFEDAAREATRDKTYQPKELRGMSALLSKTLEQTKEGTRTVEVDAYQNLPGFQEVLDRKGIGFAKATKEDAEKSQREAVSAKKLGNYSPSFREGDIVAIRAWDGVRRGQGGEIIPPGQKVYKLEQRAAKKFIAVLGIENQLQGIEPTKKQLEIKAQDRTRDNAEKRREIHLRNARRGRGAARSMGNTDVLASVGLTKTTGRIVGKSLDVVAGMFESLIAPVLTPEQILQGERAAATREAETSDTIDLARFTSERGSAFQAEREKPREVERDR